ncbi:MAG: hypothetical protein R2711_05870 [Acidimicrobiales bacterium]
MFIRSMATRGHLGGLALAAPEAIRALDAAGYPWVLVETVGVGQAGRGGRGRHHGGGGQPRVGRQRVQANRPGLMEIADVFVVNKADRPGACRITVHDLEGICSTCPGGRVATSCVSLPGPLARAPRAVDAVPAHRAYLERSGDTAVGQPAVCATSCRRGGAAAALRPRQSIARASDSDGGRRPRPPARSLVGGRPPRPLIGSAP